MIIEANSIRMVRTEEGKRLRKMYENHELNHGFNEHREMELRTDGVSNTLTSVQKDNLVFERKICAVDEQNMNLRYETFGTLTTDGSSPKHNNRVMETVRIKQATKDGYIECKIGGGGRPEFP